jgi:hypothetical protein
VLGSRFPDIRTCGAHDVLISERRAEGKLAPSPRLYATLAPKLLNASTRQAETLAKLQQGGEQVVKHIQMPGTGLARCSGTSRVSPDGNVQQMRMHARRACSRFVYRTAIVGAVLERGRACLIHPAGRHVHASGLNRVRTTMRACAS